MLKEPTTHSKVIANLSQLQPLQDNLNSDRYKAFKRLNELITERTIALETYTEHYY